jgi:hypothetical protein
LQAARPDIRRIVALGPRVIKRRLCSRGNLERTVMVRPIPASSILDALPGEVSRGLFAHGRSVSLEAELVDPKPGYVRIRVEACGVCHTGATRWFCISNRGMSPGFAA